MIAVSQKPAPPRSRVPHDGGSCGTRGVCGAGRTAPVGRRGSAPVGRTGSTAAGAARLGPRPPPSAPVQLRDLPPLAFMNWLSISVSPEPVRERMTASSCSTLPATALGSAEAPSVEMIDMSLTLPSGSARARAISGAFHAKPQAPFKSRKPRTLRNPGNIAVLDEVGEGTAQQVGVAAQDGCVYRVEGQADLLGVGREPGQVDHQAGR